MFEHALALSPPARSHLHALWPSYPVGVSGAERVTPGSYLPRVVFLFNLLK